MTSNRRDCNLQSCQLKGILNKPAVTKLASLENNSKGRKCSFGTRSVLICVTKFVFKSLSKDCHYGVQPSQSKESEFETGLYFAVAALKTIITYWL